MVKIKIPEDATLADIAQALSNPVEYIRRVLASLVECGARKDRDYYAVEFSLQSDPAAPDYQIVEIMDYESGGAMPLNARRGKSHKVMNDDNAMKIIWWGGRTTFREVQKLLGELRAVVRAS